jgi:transcriptional regulator with XRE-family HTH domain
MPNKYSTLIQSLRKERGFSQLEIAERLGISRSSYIAFEQGKRELTLAEANELGKIFQISLDEIFAGKMDTPASPVVLSGTSLAKETSKKYSSKKDVSTARISVPQERMEKFKQVFLYMISKIGGKPNIGMTVLYKILYFIDFDYYEKFEEQLIGARYMKNTHGPTPIVFPKLIRELEEEGKLETVKSKFYTYEQTKYLVNPGISLDLSALSGQELAHIDWEINRFSEATASQISALSHKDTPWLVAKDKEIINYEHVFYRPEETSVREYEPL